MKPRGPLMIEHRLIEKMIGIIRGQIDSIEESHRVDPLLIDTIVDFVRTYADRTHHGKEEDILFKKLDNKNLSASDKRIMEELIEEHKYGREIVAELVDANLRYVQGDEESISDIISKLKALADFYPDHIKKEDDVFFPDTEKYFTEGELNHMLDDFWEFDRKMIHEKYQNVVDQTSKLDALQ
ncbi:MAG: hemerythrin domain-containing protein [candidate division KSB1 bacterium]|jgi:hemerythrin-like domain-containing protein|nr:hemerythrin domain-containing protein [candidate division KSB1 bacterium]